MIIMDKHQKGDRIRRERDDASERKAHTQKTSPFSYMADRLFVSVTICRARPLLPLEPAEPDCSATSMRSSALVKVSAASV